MQSEALAISAVIGFTFFQPHITSSLYQSIDFSSQSLPHVLHFFGLGSILSIVFAYVVATYPVRLSSLHEALEQDIWLWVSDRDDSLTEVKQVIEDETRDLWDEAARLNPELDLAVISGASAEDVRLTVTDHLRIKNRTYVYGTSGAEAYAPDQERGSTPMVSHRLSLLGMEVLEIIKRCIVTTYLKFDLEKEPHIKSDYMISLPMRNTALHLRQQLKEELRKITKPIAPVLKIAYSSAAVDIALTDKGEAIQDLVRRIARKRRTSMSEVYNHTVVVGDSDNDVVMLNWVARRGGKALWVGHMPLPKNLDKRVLIASRPGPAGQRDALRIYVNWRRQQQSSTSHSTPQPLKVAA